MKKLVLLLLIAVTTTLTIVASGYSPTMSLEASLLEEKVEGEKMRSLSWGGRVDLLSLEMGKWGFSLPFSGETLTPSISSSSVFIPRRTRISLGPECRIKVSRFSFFLSLEALLTDYSDLMSVLGESRIRGGAGIEIAKYLELRFPLSLVLSQVTPGFSFSVSLKVGGEI